jgi:hypothetical protein
MKYLSADRRRSHGAIRAAALGLFTILLAAIAPTPAEAGFLAGFTGSTAMAGGASGIVNYAVFQNTGADWLAFFGLDQSTAAKKAVALSGTINTADAYIYLYQIVNTSNANNLVQLKVPNGGAPFSSMGYFDLRIFLDAGGKQVGPPANQNLTGLLGTGTTSSAPGGPASINAGGANPNSGGGLASFAWTNPILPAGYSSIVFATSKFAPILAQGSIRDNNGGISTGLIAAAPEPSSLAMIVIGIVTACAYRRAHSRRPPLK